MNKAFLILSCLALIAGCGKQPAAESVGIPERIISLAPSNTEILYALGLGDKVVGATTYCTYPEPARNIPRVGGFGQYNFEAIISLQPDIVVLHWKYEAEKSRLDSLGIPYIETRTEHLSDILESIRIVGEKCGASEQADNLAGTIENRISRHAKPSEHVPRVLMTFGGDASQLNQIHAFGADCLHNDLLELAGGKNVIENRLAFSSLSREAVIRLNPDIIIQMMPGVEAPDDPVKTWEELSGVEAVKNRRVYALTNDYVCIPGPRFIRIFEDFTRVLQP